MTISNLTLSPTERDSLITLTQRLIQFQTEDPPGEDIEMAQFLHHTLQSWGFETHLDEFEPGRANVIARLRGDGSAPGLAFSAHNDTTTLGLHPWDYPPFGGEVHDGKLYGRGAADMKGGMAAMMVAARKASQWSESLKGDLILAFASSHSSNCSGAKRMVETNGLEGAGAIVISEPTSLGVLIAETGTWWVRAMAKGIPGHAAWCTTPSYNAILNITDLVQKLRHFEFDVKPHPLLGSPTLRVGLISGGRAIAQTPDHAEIGLDIRFLPGMETSEMLATLQEIAGPDIRFETIDWKPPVEMAVDHPLVQLAVDACAWRLGKAPQPKGVSYYSDGVILTPGLNIPRVIIGPGELGQSGQRNEYVEIESLVASAEIYAWMAHTLLV